MITKILTFIMVLLVMFDVLRLYFKKYHPDLEAVNQFFDVHFKLTGEYNFPTMFSSLILLMASFLLLLIYLSSEIKKNRVYWISLSFIFFFLALDESFKIHEGLSQMIRDNITVEGSIHYGTWAIPYLIISAGLGLAYLRFVLSLPNKTKILIIISGAIYVGGAAGFEFIEGYYHTTSGGQSVMYKLFHSTQEILEMVGIILFNYTLLDYLSINKTAIEITAT